MIISSIPFAHFIIKREMKKSRERKKRQQTKQQISFNDPGGFFYFQEGAKGKY